MCIQMNKILGTNTVSRSLQLNLSLVKLNQSKMPLGRTVFSQLNNWGILIPNQIDKKEDTA